MSGSIRISRALWDSGAFRDEPFSEREAWIWMIAEASWKPRKRRVGDVVVDLERGQLAASVRFLAGAWKWSAPKVQRYLKRLIKMDLICSKTDTGVTVVTICKYDDYQSQPKASDTPPIQDRYRPDTNENNLERKRKEKSKRASDALAPLLGDDLAEKFLAHRKAMKSPMTDHAAALMAKRLANMADPVGAAEEAIRNGWKDCYPPKGGKAAPPKTGHVASGAFGNIPERN